MIFKKIEGGVQTSNPDIWVRLIFKEDRILVWDFQRDSEWEFDKKYGVVGVITAEHFNICCENVYAQFPQDSYLNDEDLGGDTILFEKVPDFGFRIGIGNRDWNRNAFMWESIPCYSEGYNGYSSEISVLFDNFLMLTLDYEEVQDKSED